MSFRQHNEFHEQCVERIFCDLMHYAKPEKLTVYARYTRRGGLDINPFRSNFEAIPQNLRLARHKSKNKKCGENQPHFYFIHVVES